MCIDATPKRISVSSPPIIEDVQKILTQLGENRFMAEFGYPYKGRATNPDDISSSQNAHAHNAEAFLYFKDHNLDNMNTWLESHVIKLFSSAI
jgi:hypothetical protein